MASRARSPLKPSSSSRPLRTSVTARSRGGRESIVRSVWRPSNLWRSGRKRPVIIAIRSTERAPNSA
jgi:hypothetical protein